MKSLLLILFATVTLSATNKHPQKALLLICQGTENFSRDNPRAEEVLLLREEMESLIKEGNIPIVLEYDKNVIWIILNDPYTGRDYPEAEFDSDYFDIIGDLFHLKLNPELKRSLQKSNKDFINALGIEYQVKNEEIISIIDYDKFDKYAF